MNKIEAAININSHRLPLWLRKDIELSVVLGRLNGSILGPLKHLIDVLAHLLVVIFLARAGSVVDGTVDAIEGGRRTMQGIKYEIVRLIIFLLGRFLLMSTHSL